MILPLSVPPPPFEDDDDEEEVLDEAGGEGGGRVVDATEVYIEPASFVDVYVKLEMTDDVGWCELVGGGMTMTDDPVVMVFMLADDDVVVAVVVIGQLDVGPGQPGGFPSVLL